MQTDSSARRTYLASRSASEWTTTVLIASSRQARWTRSAISPRFAIRILSKSFGGIGGTCGRGGRRRRPPGSADHEQRLAELDRLAVLDEHRLDDAGGIGLDLVHQLHRFDDAERIARLDAVPHLDEWIRTRGRGTIERPDQRTFHDVPFGLGRP